MSEINDYTPDVCQVCEAGKKIKELETENARLKEHLGDESMIPWLTEAAQILLDEHDFDGDCWESMTSAAIAGRNWVAKYMPERLERIPQIKSKIHGEQATAVPSRVEKLEGLLRRIQEKLEKSEFGDSMWMAADAILQDIRAAMGDSNNNTKEN